jgi:hypothetical protein
MTVAQGLSLFVGAVCAGALNAVAGGGTFVVFPILIFLGLPPIQANATCTAALWPGDMASVIAYRRTLGGQGARLRWFGMASVLGGALGAVLLLRTPERRFTQLIPVMLLGATLLFTFGPALVAKARGSAREGRVHLGLGAAAVLQFAVAIYGGYFGAGMGIMMLALFSLLPFEGIHAMNGLKALLGVMLNGLAIVVFAWVGAIAWGPGLLMAVGATMGAFLGATVAQRVHPRWVRGLVIVIAWAMTGYFVWKSFSAP